MCYCFFLGCQTLYQKKAEGFEKELVIAKQQNKRLKAKVENLRNQLEQNVSSMDVEAFQLYKYTHFTLLPCEVR